MRRRRRKNQSVGSKSNFCFVVSRLIDLSATIIETSSSSTRFYSVCFRGLDSLGKQQTLDDHAVAPTLFFPLFSLFLSVCLSDCLSLLLVFSPFFRIKLDDGKKRYRSEKRESERARERERERKWPRNNVKEEKRKEGKLTERGENDLF